MNMKHGIILAVSHLALVSAAHSREVTYIEAIADMEASAPGLSTYQEYRTCRVTADRLYIVFIETPDTDSVEPSIRAIDYVMGCIKTALLHYRQDLSEGR